MQGVIKGFRYVKTTSYNRVFHVVVVDEGGVENGEDGALCGARPGGGVWAVSYNFPPSSSRAVMCQRCYRALHGEGLL